MIYHCVSYLTDINERKAISWWKIFSYVVDQINQIDGRFLSKRNDKKSIIRKFTAVMQRFKNISVTKTNSYTLARNEGR